MRYSNIDELLRDGSDLEILLESIFVDKNSIVVYPISCPAVGRVDDYLEDSEGNPACCFGGTSCKYFGEALFTLQNYTKKIICNFSKMQ